VVVQIEVKRCERERDIQTMTAAAADWKKSPPRLLRTLRAAADMPYASTKCFRFARPMFVKKPASTVRSEVVSRNHKKERDNVSS
jgi:hypothetical protein